MKSDDILEYSPFLDDSKKADELFVDALQEVLIFHYDNNEIYRRFCDGRNYNPHEKRGNIEEVPYIPVQLFKRRKLLSVPEKDIIDIRKSSSTSTGTPSVVYRDKVTLDRYFRSRNKIFDEFINDRGKVHFCLGEQPDRDITISRNLVNSLIGERAGKSEQYYFMNDGTFDWKVFLDLFEENQRLGKEIGLIYGGTAILYLYLVKPMIENNIRLKYDGYIAHGGGWKKLQNMQVSKSKFLDELLAVFDMPVSNIIDMYGFSESNSMFIDCEYGNKHVPIWNKVIIRDCQTMKPVEAGKEGIIQILDVLPYSYPGNSLITDDIGYVCKDKKCKCGRAGQIFKVIKRANGSEAKGCGDMLADLMERRGTGINDE
ncbi:MAG: hypothetical protein K2N34_10115 [Lachnospiraceae bacterium]|nr:hypothetical protein [Lachnospiraceae bacterium]